MSTKPSNHAAWLTAKNAQPLEVRSAPYTAPGENEIVIKNSAIAVNPVESMKQILGDMLFAHVKYPFIMGSDLAGTVASVGKGVKRFKIGDRVLAHAVGMDPRSNKSSEGAFQEYTVVRAKLTAPIPDSLPFENACVLPLCLSTAACGLFQKDCLALPHPSTTPTPTGTTLLIWGGSTSVGSNAIQLAVAAGCKVITTASPHNFEYVKKLGASEAFDYRSKTVVRDIIEALKNEVCAGAFAIGNGSVEACIEVLGAMSRGTKFIAQASIDMPDELPKSKLAMVPFGISYGWWNMSVMVKSRMKGVNMKFTFGSDLMANEVCHIIYKEFLPAALAQGRYVAAPEPQVVGNGLEYIQEALDVQRRGVSAKKVVVSL